MAVAETYWREPAPPQTDFCDDQGALQLKQAIEGYWNARGYQLPKVTLHTAGFTASMRSSRTDIRSDMINGLPRKHK